MNERMFPIMGGPAIPWALIEPHERQAQRNHSQTLHRLAERGGLSPCEAVAVLEDREWQSMTDDAAKGRLQRLVDASLQLKLDAALARVAALEAGVNTALWIVGRVADIEAARERAGGEWMFQGVFATEDAAVAACRDESYFIGPAVLGRELPHEPTDWTGARYPIVPTV